ncbi:transglycosylase domain-containing protein [Parasphingopyxis marina]|uniref:Transglycosylase domain-containing protein n=1 Tax=Parasphingopyxis marina TaxID=2761622 RepID=A0A842HZA6_9SPHN|nr:transglycosylase domain-containing protein [Parasphingopyxis marina]MBC2778282.1 transglycosylase domain-containing protein [Parasphingopyxis marina]
MASSNRLFPWSGLFARSAPGDRASYDHDPYDDDPYDEYYAPHGEPSDEGDEFPDEPPRGKWRRRWRIARWGLRISLALLAILIGWLLIWAPVSRTAEPLVPPPIVLTASDGTPIARMGPIMEAPVRMSELPPHVRQAFLAIEDRRFDDHWGIDPQGIARALWTNITSDETHGGSTITQQLAKLTYLNSERTLFRKIREVPIALWLELWLTKDEILERYLSNTYFGDNVYGLRAASLHYFYRQPENLTLSQATMLAGLVKAPSRLAPTHNLELAQARQRIVLSAMVDAGYLTQTEADAVEPATVDHRPPPPMPRGSYFADWALAEARETHATGYDTIEIRTTLNAHFQSLAERVTRQGTPAGAQVALVAMRTNGEVVAMVGGQDYDASPFNRATQAVRQPGSTFKLIVYFAALEAGLTPDTMVEDSPIEFGEYRPENAGGRYRGRITLREAFARSSNVVAVRLYQQLGPAAIADAAQKLGLERELPGNASAALGSGGMTLIELVSAYAAVANGASPVTPHALVQPDPGFFERIFDSGYTLSTRRRGQLLDLLGTAIDDGTGTAARLPIPAYGKTGTSQDSRDALFIGFAGDLVVGVWIGNDDNTPLGHASGGGAPARIWRNFMTSAIADAAPRQLPRPAPVQQPEEPEFDKPDITIDADGVTIGTSAGSARITVDDDGIDIEPDPEIRRRLDELERIGNAGEKPPADGN